MAMNNGANISGVAAFSYTVNQNVLAGNEKIKRAHDKLVAISNLFVGFHGTSQSAAESQIGGSPPRPPILNSEKKAGGVYWDGFYVSNAVEYALDYTTEVDNSGKRRVCEFIRANLTKSKVVKFLMSERPIKSALRMNHFRNLVNRKHHRENGEYLLAGSDEVSGEHSELVTSAELLPHLIFLRSLHSVTFSGGAAELKVSKAESKSSTSISISAASSANPKSAKLL